MKTNLLRGRRRLLARVTFAPLLCAVPARAVPAAVHVFKNPSCGCCAEWVKHLEAAGFSVAVTAVEDTGPIRKRLGMPDTYGGCHTATVDGYVIEGHVPATDVKRLLQSKPSAIGLAVPGMPAGSPGMEAGSRRDPYEVLLVDRTGAATVFARYAR